MQRSRLMMFVVAVSICTLAELCISSFDRLVMVQIAPTRLASTYVGLSCAAGGPLQCCKYGPFETCKGAGNWPCNGTVNPPTAPTCDPNGAFGNCFDSQCKYSGRSADSCSLTPTWVAIDACVTTGLFVPNNCPNGTRRCDFDWFSQALAGVTVEKCICAGTLCKFGQPAIKCL